MIAGPDRAARASGFASAVASKAVDVALALRWLAGALLLTSAMGSVLAAPDTDSSLASARSDIDEIRQRMTESTTLEAMSALRSRATAVRRRAIDIAGDLMPQRTHLDARLSSLGSGTSTDNPTTGVENERGVLAQQRLRVDAQLRLARLLAVESQQAVEQLDDLRRARLGAHLSGRTASLLDRAFWTELRDSWPQNRHRISGIVAEALEGAREARPLRLTLALAIASALLGAATALHRKFPRIATAFLPAHRLRRSAGTLALALLAPAAWLAAVTPVTWALTAEDASGAVKALWSGIRMASAFGIYVAALGRALLSVARPSWRLLPLPDAMAVRLRHDPLLLGAVIGVAALLDRLSALVHVDLASVIAANGVFSLLLGLLLVWTLRRGEQARRSGLKLASASDSPLRSSWLTGTEALCWSALVFSIACLLLGFLALGSIVVKQVAWFLIVAGSAYMLNVFVADACAAWAGAANATGEGASETAAGQRVGAAVLLSAVGRLLVLAIAAIAVLGPLGQSLFELMERISALRDGVAVGEMRVLPGAVFHSLLILGIGLWSISVSRRWLLEDYLPTTKFDSGMRHSVATLASWVGYLVTVALSLSAIGLGLERVTWIASALSVGIGFGLRVFVQNFIAGLVLLTERPLGIGDLVEVDGIEGEIRRINLRTTELELADHSLSLIPNFLFTTKTVRNMGHGHRQGWVEIRLAMPLGTDVDLVLDAMFAAMAAHEDVLGDPAPTALVDGFGAGSISFVATCSVSSPRHAARIRSALSRDILAKAAHRGLDLDRASRLLLQEPASPVRATAPAEVEPALRADGVRAAETPKDAGNAGPDRVQR